jgi:hypothetical protein
MRRGDVLVVPGSTAGIWWFVVDVNGPFRIVTGWTIIFSGPYEEIFDFDDVLPEPSIAKDEAEAGEPGGDGGDDLSGVHAHWVVLARGCGRNGPRRAPSCSVTGKATAGRTAGRVDSALRGDVLVAERSSIVGAVSRSAHVPREAAACGPSAG